MQSQKTGTALPAGNGLEQAIAKMQSPIKR